MWAHAQPITAQDQLRLSDLAISSATAATVTATTTAVAATAAPVAATTTATTTATASSSSSSSSFFRRWAGPDSGKPPSEPKTKPVSCLTFLDTDDEAPVSLEPVIRPAKDGLQVIVESTLVADATALAGAALPPASPVIADQSHAPRQAWPPPRRESLTNKSPTPWTTQNTDKMDTINIAVIGSRGVGKSAFIQRALRLSRPPSSSTTTVRQELDGIPHAICLVEFELEYFDLEDVGEPGQQIHWPKQINGQFIPRLEGAFVLYDVSNKDSIRQLNPGLTNNLPSMLVATKCDVPESQRELDVTTVARTTQSYPACFADFLTSTNSPASQRECLQTMLKAIISNRKGTLERPESVSRRRAASTAHLDTPADPNGRPISQGSTKHSRASSDLSLLRGFPSIANDGFYRPSSRSPRPDQGHTAPSVFGSELAEEGTPSTVHGVLRTPGIHLDGVRLEQGGDTFLELEESESDSYTHSEDIPILQRNDEHFADRPAKVMGVTFDELVDRLVAMKMSRADNNFADVFLCLYRQFAPPGQLLGALRTRLERVKEDRGTHYLVKTDLQLRIVEVIAKWVSMYPGDFARPATRRSLDELIRQLSTEPIFAGAAHQMRLFADQRVVEDDDTGWAKSDDVEDAGDGHRDHRASELFEKVGSLHLDEPASMSAEARRPSQGPDTGGPERGGRSTLATLPTSFQFYSYEDYEREAATLVPSALLPMSKTRYRSFMDTDADELADEMTRIDWVMFSSIRVRDFVRHVSLKTEQKERCRSLQNVNRMIQHFNHVARWVGNVVLIRDKAKHRAPALEKFMQVALRLRQLNNYNGLAAVLAGISDAAVHRLAQTRALVSPDVQKRFARLQLLMGTQKSHFAYRLAWENSPLPRIPFIPLHRRDLVSAEEGSRTLVGPDGDRINWKKFEILGEVILPLMKSQGQPYGSLGRHEASRELILDCRLVTDEEDIYQRSVQVESGVAESSKKKFPWLAN